MNQKHEIRDCPICASARRKAFTGTILDKHEVTYFTCDACGFLQTERPYWLDEAYSSAIADSDTGLVLRNLAIARRLTATLYFCFDRAGSYVDAAGGYGLLVRLMRDVGFRFYWQDKYCENLFARGYAADRIVGPVTAVTAFEVLEHIHEPVEFLNELLERYGTRTVVFSTELFSGEPPAPGSWWYYAPEAGQHISFYQERTLRTLGERLSLRLYSNRGMHVLTDREISPVTFRFLTAKGSWPAYVWARLQMSSLTFKDHEEITRSGGRGSRS